MTGKRLMLAAIAPLLLCAGIAGGVYAASMRPTIYTVSEVASGLNQNPAAWVGRTVLIWGRDLTVRWACGFWSGTAPNTAGGTSVSTCRTGTFEQLVPARPARMLWAGNGLRPRVGASYTIYSYISAPAPRFAFRRGLLVQRQPGAHLPTTSTPIGLIAQLARLPVVGQLIPATLVESGAVYRIRLLESTHCSSPPCPQGELL